MATKITKIQVRRDTALNWTSVDPILSVGEIGFESDSGFQGGRMKFGDGERPWSLLDYYGSGELGNFNEITNNGPKDPSTSYYPNVPPLSGGVDGIVVSNYAASNMGVYVAGLATYNHIFPSVDGVTIGTPNQRFSEVYVKSNSLHIGDDSSDEIILSHLAGATKLATIRITGVGLGGRVTAFEWGREIVNNMNVENRGEGYRVGQGLSVEYDANSGAGKGLRFNIISVDATGAIQDIEILDAGAGYESNEIVQVVLRSQLAITRNDLLGTTTTTEVATKQALEQVNSQTLNLIGPGEPVASYIENSPRTLPDNSGFTSQSQFNGWTVDSLEQLDSQKVQLQNCTNQIEGKGPTIDPQTGLPEYTVLLNNKKGVINPAFAGIPATKSLKGGEILFFDTALQQWEVASGSGGGGVGNEEDPIFVASDAYRLEEASDDDSKFLQYTTKVGLGAGPEKIMFIDNWDAIPYL